jgi:hypothetical protein
LVSIDIIAKRVLGKVLSVIPFKVKENREREVASNVTRNVILAGLDVIPLVWIFNQPVS